MEMETQQIQTSCNITQTAVVFLSQDQNDCHALCRCKFRLKTDRTSLQNLKASNIGNKHNNEVSVGSQNHDLIGIALSVNINEKHQLELLDHIFKCVV